METQGPRIFNQITEAERVALYKKKKMKEQRQRYQKRRKWLVILFGVVIALLTFQIVSSNIHTFGIKNDLKSSQAQLEKAKASNTKLKGEVKLLNDDTYIGKLIRYKYFYSKPGEQVYNLPDDKLEVNTK